MLVEDVLSFIREVQEFNLKNLIDDAEIARLNDHFKKFKPDHILQKSEHEVLCDFFKIRWNQIKDTDCKYTSDPYGLNQYYISLSKKINEKKYLSILMPDITNEIDFNDLSKFTETKRLENFFIGEGPTLYRKRSFYDLLDKKTEFKLAINRDFSRFKLRALSVGELSDLSYCKADTNFNTEDGLFFESFWDFLYKKTFPKLQDHGFVPVSLLQSLQVLIGKYYSFRQQNREYDAFKKEAKQFFQEVLEFDLDDINCFYGMKIRLNNQEIYMLQYLIKINRSKGYEIDSSLEVLAQWLYQISPTLKVTDKKFERLYTSPSSTSESPLLSVMLSLCVCSFPSELFESENKITVWDRENPVFPKGCILFGQLQKKLSTGELPGSYAELKEMITTLISEEDLHSEEAANWYRCVKSNALSELSVYWFEPEFILHTLIKFDLKTEEKKKFLDELIRTYRLDADKLSQRMRVNILFHHFSTALPQKTKNDLIQLIQLNSHINFNIVNCFLSDSISYLKSQLDRIAGFKNTTGFWKQTSLFNQLFIESSPIDLKETIDRFCTAIEDSKKQLEESNYIAMMDYMTFFSSPILTVKKTEAVERSNDIFLFGQASNW